ncbi:maltokinase N-terminal cap-like domain-containing protein [Nakamurella deserti]|uniref:maltokinase N-terminal cap-like domain-containing protein n=1 Tax=Nakamurella deserti TaxID=2164074 RepID=UPI001300201F|nr:aminoglycoside phosphotransferase [Nakamurella deserti]
MSSLTDLLHDWLPRQRWFAAKGVDLHSIGTAASSRLADALDTPDGPLQLDHLILEVHSALGKQHYQLFVGRRPWLPDRLAHATIGTADGLVAYDALHDPVVTGELIAGLATGRVWGDVRLVPEPGADIDPAARGRMISGEQSNTSIIYGDSGILKVYRRLEPGVNPDVEIHRALSSTGSPHVARALAVLESDALTTDDGNAEPTTLGFLSSFFANSADGWAMATTSVRDLLAEGDLRADEVGGDFAAESFRLGVAVAEVHRDLAAAFGEVTLSSQAWSDVVTAMIDEARRVAGHVPAVAERLPAVIATFEAARSLETPVVVQRVHGDLHLGQTLRTLTGWAIIDFEGEPAKSLPERKERQLLAKDVAGMLRSFDYAANHLLPTGATDPQQTYRAAEWAHRNRDAFLDGYRSADGAKPLGAPEVITAFELDKAVYEVAYEHGNRPTWEPIPLHAVDTLIKAGGTQ